MQAGNGNNGNGRPPVDGATKTVSRDELEAMADQAAQGILGVESREQAFAMLERGELEGTAAAAEFQSFRFMLQGE